ncbi:inositol monophosphatase family protein [Hufsiella ginkgonis]|uniref:Inositol-1-monophosphatase n=1 Tax=Hufsiella ginkgonis TaxID=2695274 RepID=A0A7K1XXA3_9SPHI|nr:inositol monophosphatase family protein [Hufsiella ginkgonis]MXV15467.1 inositol monophosphatase [Hufsiella ginkgonis]
MDLQNLIGQVAELAKQAGAFIRGESEKFSTQHIEYKGLNNLVSYVDKSAEEMIVTALAELLPQAGFITEEETINVAGDEYNWIVDPLDGTTNFIHGLPTYSVSIALQHREELVLGVVYEINRDECFYAWKEGGAWLNGKRIAVSANEKLSQSLLATGFPYYDFEKLEKYLQVFRELTQVTHGLRRVGSAAVDLAYVACGRYEGFFEYNLNSYDMAAGIVLVNEAGGKTVNFKGEKEFFKSREIVATNAEIAPKLLEVIQRYF